MPQRDRPDIVAPPPLLYLAALVAVVILDRVRPVAILEHDITAWLGGTAMLAGLAFNLWGVWSMRRASTPINPYRPVEAIVRSGAFAISRNPLYVGLNLLLLGFVLVLNTLWGIAVFVVLLAIMHYGVILPEERYLQARFGEAYSRYRADVRRYL